ncbi:MAG: hypothetical protein AWU57_289 [Marinobacter sp. T13-3]|nr:MAG: hypothetical protein AWU57_289 [Marinobacter sp. T13-3]
MKRGATEAETLRLNGWGVGDILEGTEGSHTDRIWITCIGQEAFLCRWDYGCTGEFGEEDGQATLTCREWEKVAHKPVDIPLGALPGAPEGHCMDSGHRELKARTGQTCSCPKYMRHPACTRHETRSNLPEENPWAPAGTLSELPPTTLFYTNWKGETRLRRIIPESVRLDSTQWHPEPQYLIRALDVEKQAYRDFALKDFHGVAHPDNGADTSQEDSEHEHC